MKKQIKIANQKQIELVAESLARILIQQITGKKNALVNTCIGIENGKSN